jgi:hypothetical protein
MPKKQNEKKKNNKVNEDALTEKEMKDLQTFAEIIVDIVMDEMKKENISLKNINNSNEKP